MAFYESTIIAKQDSNEKELNLLESKYSEIINNFSGNLIKVEKWGLINFAKKIKNYNKGFYIHYKFEGNKKTLDEIKKKINLDSSILRHLLVKYKKLDTKTEFFQKK